MRTSAFKFRKSADSFLSSLPPLSSFVANLAPKCITVSQIRCTHELWGSNGEGAFVLLQHADASEAVQQNTGMTLQEGAMEIF